MNDIGDSRPDPVPSGAAADEATYLDLHDERERLERALALNQAQQRFSPDPAEVERARAEEGPLLGALDRVMTRIRAAEYRRRPGARRW